MILSQRTSGVLLHPTSLPGPFGSGDFGESAYHFVDWLQSANQSLWQVLPLGPIGPGNAPYQSVSAFAGNPLFIDLQALVEEGWLAPIDQQTLDFSPHRVDYGRVIPWRMAKLQEAFQGFQQRATVQQKEECRQYSTEEAGWLSGYALFMALDQAFAGVPWPDWPVDLAKRRPPALQQARQKFATSIQFWEFTQWIFDRQWRKLHRYARDRGVRLVGDLPIFIAHHSADCWENPQLYHLDARGYPSVVAGVPPDFFSVTGQRWGNPLYDWGAMQKEGYQWWVARMRRQLQLADIVRIDHFRGFAGYWEIPASEPTAIHGRWVSGPGFAVFEAIRRALGDLPIIAEDLGVITPDVEALRQQCGFPGMRILQFAFNADAQHNFLPHHYVQNTVAYTGTHDNDTVRGWWATCSDLERAYAASYLGFEPGMVHGENIHWAMIQSVAASVANLAIYPFQDVLGLDGYHRMNIPGQTGCWEWRFSWDYVGEEPARRLARVTALTGRGDFAPANLPAYPSGLPRP